MPVHPPHSTRPYLSKYPLPPQLSVQGIACPNTSPHSVCLPKYSLLSLQDHTCPNTPLTQSIRPYLSKYSSPLSLQGHACPNIPHSFYKVIPVQIPSPTQSTRHSLSKYSLLSLKGYAFPIHCTTIFSLIVIDQSKKVKVYAIPKGVCYTKRT